MGAGLRRPLQFKKTPAMRVVRSVVLGVVAGMAIVLLYTGCTTTYPTSGIGMGSIVRVTEPVAAGKGEAQGQLKQGTATCLNILGLAVVGDCSIHAAATNGGITSISHVDKRVRRGIISKVTTIVYGY